MSVGVDAETGCTQGGAGFRDESVGDEAEVSQGAGGTPTGGVELGGDVGRGIGA